VLDESEHFDPLRLEVTQTIPPRGALLGGVVVAPQPYVGVPGRQLYRAIELVVVVDAECDT
jgi:hypothetical protein